MQSIVPTASPIKPKLANPLHASRTPACYHARARFAFLALASAASAAPVASVADVPAPGTAVTPTKMIRAFEENFGAHPGERMDHAKGLCAAGSFVGTSEAATLSRSALFSGKNIPVVARFSVAGGTPSTPHAAPVPRGMALELRLPGGALATHEHDRRE